MSVRVTIVYCDGREVSVEALFWHLERSRDRRQLKLEWAPVPDSPRREIDLTDVSAIYVDP